MTVRKRSLFTGRFTSTRRIEVKILVRNYRTKEESEKKEKD
jgi:hypothetical protein